MAAEGTPGPGVSRRRRLQHASSKAANVTVVTTAQQLQEAIAAGKEHIEIRQHLDLTTLHIVESDGKTPIDEDDAILGAVPPSVKSIRAKCSTAPAAGSFGLDDHVPLLPLLQQQCLLVTDGDVMQVLSDLWLDGLYLRMRNTVRFPTPQLLLVRGAAAGRPAEHGRLWMTFCTVQGEQGESGEGGISGLQSLGSVHAEECTFANLGGTADAVELVGPGASAFCDCTFRNNVVAMTGTAVITARGADASLLRCTFSGNSGAGHLLMLGAAESHSTAYDGAGSALYSDQPREVCVEVALQSCARMGGTPGCVTDVMSPVQTLPADEWPPSDPAAAEEDSWFQETRKDTASIYRQRIGRSSVAPNRMGDCTPEGPQDSSLHFGTLEIAIVIASAVAALAAIIAAATFCLLRRRRRAPARALHEQGKDVQASTVLHVHL